MSVNTLGAAWTSGEVRPARALVLPGVASSADAPAHRRWSRRSEADVEFSGVTTRLVGGSCDGGTADHALIGFTPDLRRTKSASARDSPRRHRHDSRPRHTPGRPAACRTSPSRRRARSDPSATFLTQSTAPMMTASISSWSCRGGGYATRPSKAGFTSGGANAGEKPGRRAR